MNAQLSDEIDQALAELESTKLESLELIDSPSAQSETFPWAVLVFGLFLGSFISGIIAIIISGG